MFALLWRLFGWDGSGGDAVIVVAPVTDDVVELTCIADETVDLSFLADDAAELE